MHTFDTNGVQIVPLQSKQLVEDAKTTLESLYPLSNHDVAVHEFGNDGVGTFPTRYDALNRVGVSMELIGLAQRFFENSGCDVDSIGGMGKIRIQYQQP